MPKIKTNRAAAKRFKKTGTGKLVRNKAYKSHILTKKSTKRKRKTDCYRCNQRKEHEESITVSVRYRQDRRRRIRDGKN